MPRTVDRPRRRRRAGHDATGRGGDTDWELGVRGTLRGRARRQAHRTTRAYVPSQDQRNGLTTRVTSREPGPYRGAVCQPLKTYMRGLMEQRGSVPLEPHQ